MYLDVYSVIKIIKSISIKSFQQSYVYVWEIILSTYGR